MKKNDFVKMLQKSGIETNEARAEVELVLEYVLNKTKEEIFLLNEINDERILKIINERIETKAPIQYILGYAPFMGQKFIVNKSVLIPRDDTEILVNEAYFELKKGRKTVLDIGVGSGIISIMLSILSKKDNINAQILGADISNDAILTALDNTERLGQIGSVVFRKSDIFSNVKEKFDMIVSNPPYIPKEIYDTLDEVVKFEPEIALVAKNRGLYFFEKIIKEAPLHLNKNGVLLFEIMKGQEDEITLLMENSGFKNIQKIKDVQGVIRVIKGEIQALG